MQQKEQQQVTPAPIAATPITLHCKTADEALAQVIADMESENNIRVLIASNTGSRAHGWETHLSDYDIHFIYVRNVKFYLTMQAQKDTMEYKRLVALAHNGAQVRLLFFSWVIFNANTLY